MYYKLCAYSELTFIKDDVIFLTVNEFELVSI